MGYKALGWVIATAGLAVFAAVGFQGATNKLGVVDMARVFNDSDYAKAQESQLRDYGNARSDLLDFLEQYRVGTADQNTKLRDLVVKDPQTDQDKLDIAKLKKDIQASDQTFKQLNTKPSPTAAEVAQLNDFNSRSQATFQLLQQWNRDFQDDVAKKKSSMRDATKARELKAIRDVGAKNGYTIVFDTDAAPFGANNISDDALKAMNAQKP